MMDKTRQVWGIVCLGLALFLVATNLLVPGAVEFAVGGLNIPWLPVLLLAAVGVVLLVAPSRGRAGEERPRRRRRERAADAARAAENKRLESIAWGLFLVMLGGTLLVPAAEAPKGWWSLGLGFIFLWLNYARHRRGLRMSGFTLALGLVAVAGGLADLFLPTVEIEGPLMVIILGVYLVFKARFEDQNLFGKAEEP